jgi:hypothetical protein
MRPRTARRTPFIFFASLAAGAAAIEAACITPPPEAVDPPPTRPVILDDQVQPPLDQLLQTLPRQQFIVPVSVNDPQEHFNYSIFVDYNPITNPQPVSSFRVSPATAVTTIAFDPPSQLTANSCHRLDFLVVHDFATLTDGAVLLHTPDSAGGDQISWFYLPGGSPNGCPGYDAGIPSGDASPDGGAVP